MLVTACANQKPDLYAAVIPQRPLTDMLRYHLFPYSDKWTSEFGTSDEPGGINYLLSYSPLHNIIQHRYPAILVVTPDHDSHVAPFHSHKYISELQYTTGHIQGQRPLLIRIDEGTGSEIQDTEETLIKIADIFAFIQKVINIDWISS